jgi:hypothetical protein
MRAVVVMATMALAACRSHVVSPVVDLDEMASCGKERWSVKVASDDDASAIDARRAQRTSVVAMRALSTSQHGGARNRPVETTIYEIRGAHLLRMHDEADGDIHTVIADGKATMIVEAPSPSCMRGSRFAGAAAGVRLALSKARPGSVVSVAGVGFWDFVHGQDGHAPNGIELHPLLGVCIGYCDPLATMSGSATGAALDSYRGGRGAGDLGLDVASEIRVSRLKPLQGGADLAPPVELGDHGGEVAGEIDGGAHAGDSSTSQEGEQWHRR